MSTYESEAPIVTAEQRRMFYHRGDWSDFQNHYAAVSRAAVSEGKAGLKRLAPTLLKTIGDARTLHAAWMYNALHGGQTPGKDGRFYADYSRADVWRLCKAVARAIQDGTYCMGPEKSCFVPKLSGLGNREIVLLKLVDRMVQRAATMVLQPLFDPLFYPSSFGFRPGRGPLQALACAEHETLARKRFVWVCHDFRDAFGSVPIGRLMGLLRGYLPDAALLNFLERIITSPRTHGLRQGSALSPLLLNVYVHHFLDRPLTDRLPDVAWFRYGDDHLMTCGSMAQAIEADKTLREILLPTGLKLKASTDDAISQLKYREVVRFLGFQIFYNGRTLQKYLSERAWPQLRSKLATVYSKDHAQLKAEAIITGWIKALGPAFRHVDYEAHCKRMVRIAGRFGFEEVPDVSELIAHWQVADRRWKRLTAKVARHEPHQNKSHEIAVKP
ncbi:MAG: hypothetical protein C0483_07580 [Pirellula sp.]|nr:hypothetical protein [Pirellula sp.]